MRKSTLSAAATALVLSVSLAACGSSSSSSTTGASSTQASPSPSTSAAAPAATQHGTVKVAISGFAFHPPTLTVAAGTKVTFTNGDQTAHTATGNKPGFDTGTVNPGKSATVVFNKPGTYTYYCQFHAFMHGTIVVK